MPTKEMIGDTVRIVGPAADGLQNAAVQTEIIQLENDNLMPVLQIR